MKFLVTNIGRCTKGNTERLKLKWTTMNDPTNYSHLSRILTNPLVLENPASFFQVYEVPIRKFFACLCRDSQSAEEQFQEFAVKFLEGAFKSFKPGKGRFRDYLKTSLRNQVRKSMRRNASPAAVLSEDWDVEDPNVLQPIEIAMREFDAMEGRQIKALVEQDMRADEEDGKNSFHSLLSFAINYQMKRASQFATKGGKTKIPVSAVVQFFEERIGEKITDETARQRMFRAKSNFASKMISEIATRIGLSSPHEIRAAANEMGLLLYVEKELERMAKGT